MIFRLLFCLLALSVPSAFASEPIMAKVAGATASVTQPHVTAELIPESTSIEGGKPFDIILHLKSDPGWHTYWINPGDAGLATTITWTLPEGFKAGPIQWPTPEKHNMGPLVTFGYEGDVYLITTITPPAKIPQGSNAIKIKAHAEWLVCQEACIPGRADFDLPLDSGVMTLRLPVENTELFAQARERLPVPNTRWDVKAAYGMSPGSQGKPSLWIFFAKRAGTPDSSIPNFYFFPEQENVLAAQEPVTGPVSQAISSFSIPFVLQQNGEKPAQMSGVVVSDQPLIGNSRSIYISSFPTEAANVPMFSPQEEAVSRPETSLKTPQPLLLAVLGAAFIGGLILNLMPCVLPVLSLKVFSLVRHSGDDPKAAWKQGAAFTAGVVISFWILAGLLLALRSAGSQLGWGFQMQSPGFVLALIFLFFLLGLNLFGVFELGASLVGLDAKATGKFHGLTSSFLNGALATVAATPCTAPFMGSALGFAAQQSIFIALLVFTFLAVGMATPYLLLTIFPGALKYVPKPGAWMEAFKQFMGFLLMATVIFLLYVFGALVGEGSILTVLIDLLLAAIAAWYYGRHQKSAIITGKQFPDLGWTLAIVAVLLLVGFNFAFPLPPSNGPAKRGDSTAKVDDVYQPWSPAAVEQALSEGKPVFVDFTAAWCLSCKVNEKLALGATAVQKAFKDKGVVLFRADWTHSDPLISKTLRQFNRDGVPLYLLYSPKAKDAPQVLPEVLTPGIVLEALNKL